MLYCTLYSIFPLKTLHSRSCEGFERCRQGSSCPLPRSAAPASQKEIDSNELNVAVHFCRWNICASRTDGRTDGRQRRWWTRNGTALWGRRGDIPSVGWFSWQGTAERNRLPRSVRCQLTFPANISVRGIFIRRNPLLLASALIKRFQDQHLGLNSTW